MTEKEEKVIQWAFNLTEAIVAGDWKLPKPFSMAVNYLQDAVYDLAHERGHDIKSGCSGDFLKEEEEYWKGIEESIKNRERNIRGKGEDNDRGEQEAEW